MASQIFSPLLALAWSFLALAAAFWFGGNHTTAAPALAAAALFLTSATLFTTIPRQQWPWLPLLAMGGVLGWGLIQTIPFPALANPIWTQTAAALGLPLPQTISINPANTLNSLAQGLAYLGTFVAAWLLAQRGRTASQMLRLLALSGVFLAAAGLTMFAMGNGYIWNVPKPAYLNDLSATFVNRNTYATFAGLTVLLNLAMALERWGELPSARRTPWRQRMQSFLNIILFPRWGYFVGAGIGLVALLLTHSRAGIICALLGVVVMLAGLFLQRRQSWGALITVVLLLGLGFMATFSMLGDATHQRLASVGYATSERATLYNITAQALYTVPYTGSGLGTFEETFRAARTPQLSLGLATRVDYAHNTWLQLALEIGLPAFALLLCTVGWLLMRLLTGLTDRRRGITYPALGLGAAALVGTHGLVDFSLQIPGLAYTAMLVLGLALAQCQRNRAEDTTLPSAFPAYALALPMLAALLIALPTTWAAWQTKSAHATLATLQRKQPVSTQHLTQARQTLLAYPTRYGNELTLATATLTERAKPDRDNTIAYRHHTVQHATQALSASPANPYTWHRLAAAQYRLGNPQGAATAMALSLLTGPFDPNLAWQRLPLLAVLMPHFTPDDQTFAQSLLHHLWMKYPDKTWRTINGKPALESLLTTSIQHDTQAVTLWRNKTRKPFPLQPKP